MARTNKQGDASNMLAYLALFFVGVAALKVYLDYYPAWKFERSMKQRVEQASAELPKVYNNAIRMESIRYDDKMVYATGTLLEHVPINDSHRPMFEADMKQMYCMGLWKSFAKAKVPVEFTLKFESVFYKNIEWVFKETPEVCQG